MVFYGLSLGVSILPGSTFLNMFLSAFVEMPSYVLACFLLKKVGRRWPNAGMLVACGVFCVLMGIFITNKGNINVLVSGGH